MSPTPTHPPKPSKAAGSGSGPSLVRLIADLGPALVFFFSYQHSEKNGIPDFAAALSNQQPILFATLCFLPAALAGFVLSYLKERSVSPIGVFSFIMIGLFSGLALWLKDDIFIKMRPTLIYSLMGSILIISVLARRNVLKALFSGALHMAEVHWRGLALRAGLMYLGLGLANEIVWRTQPEKTWVTYNTWGDAAINMAFWLINMVMLARHFTDADGRPLGAETDDGPDPNDADTHLKDVQPKQ